MELRLLVRRWESCCTPVDSSSAAARNHEVGQNGNKEKRIQNKTKAGEGQGEEHWVLGSEKQEETRLKGSRQERC